MKNKKLTIIGYGRFGKTLHRLLHGDFDITIYNRSEISPDDLYDRDARIAQSLEEAYKSDIIIYAVPIPAFKEVIETHKPYIEAHHTLIDVLSVKLHSKEVFKDTLKNSEAQIILAHPMFGPDSSKDGFKGLPLIIDNLTADIETYNFWKEYFQSKKLNVIEMSADEHDKLAAQSQGVTHFLGRILNEYGLEPTPIDSLGAKKLQEVMNQTCNDTWELFEGLQNYNPYTKQMRSKVGKAYDKVNSKLLPKRINKNKLLIGIQGGKGSFNEQALTELRSENPELFDTEVETKYLYTTEKVLQELTMGDIDFGLFAMHNSVGGIVEESVRAIANYKFNIVKEFAIKIQHYMMKPKDVEISEITTIMTHPQVLKQCKSTLEKKYPNLETTSGEGELIDHANVAKAMAKGELDRNIAVMGPQILSEIYDLDIIEGDLQDSKENYTSFLLVERI